MNRTLSCLLLVALTACGDAPGSSSGRGSSEGSDSGTGASLSDAGAAVDGAGADSEVGGEDIDSASPDGGDTQSDALDGDDDARDADSGDAPDARPDNDASTDAEAPDAGAEIDVEPPPPPCGGLTPAIEGALIPRESGTVTAELPPCAAAMHALVAASGSRWEVRVEGVPPDATVAVHTAHLFRDPGAGTWREPQARSVAAGDAGTTAVSFSPAYSGEQAVVIERADGRRVSTYTLIASCLEGCDRQTTRYPVALMHGYAGVDSYFGILDYFFDVKDPLQGLGYLILTPVTDPIAQSDVRADQLARQLTEAQDLTGARRFNLIAHSQGGLDARLLVAGKGWSDRVASITTIATPHRGIPLLLADFLSVQDFSPDYMDVFNAAYPDVEGVRYWSWSSRSCGILQPGCISRSDGEVVDALLGASYTLLLRFGENDGIVPTASMVWGEHLGMLYADHFDEVGQIADLSWGGDPFDHRTFYRSEMERLTAAGF
jgi:hypothetical protein